MINITKNRKQFFFLYWFLTSVKTLMDNINFSSQRFNILKGFFLLHGIFPTLLHRKGMYFFIIMSDWIGCSTAQKILWWWYLCKWRIMHRNVTPRWSTCWGYTYRIPWRNSRTRNCRSRLPNSMIKLSNNFWSFSSEFYSL